LAWTIKYADSALRQLDKPIAHRILDCLDERIATADDPRVAGKALTGPMGGDGATLSGITALSAMFVTVN